MTRDDRRNACLEAMARARFAYHVRVSGVIAEDAFTWDSLPDSVKQKYLDLEAEVFDALRLAAARVVPVEATEEMEMKAQAASWGHDPLAAIWEAMSAVADLTNPPEEKL